MWEKTKDRKPASGLLVKDLPVLIELSRKDPYGSYPHSIILTQACDIESYIKNIKKEEKEFTSRQLITQIIFCPAFDEDAFTLGTHLKQQYQYRMPTLHENDKKKYKKLEQIRYHYIESKIDKIPNFFIDFKQYFTLPARLIIDHLEIKGGPLYKLNHLHYTRLADRFAFYLQRVAI